MNIYRYPLTDPVEGGKNASLADGATVATDYVMFHRHRLNYEESGRSYYGRSFPETKSQFTYDDKRVYIAMPKTLQTSYQPRYTSIDLGVLGASTVAALGGDISNTDNLSAIISSAARAALPEFTSGAVSQLASGLSQAAGLAGGLNANSLQALTRGRVFNPFKEQIFQSMDFRQHSFQFKMVSRSLEEAQMVKNIITYFKEGSVPAIGEATNPNADNAAFGTAVGSGGLQGRISSTFNALSKNRFFQVPDSFDIKFLRMNSDGSFEGNGSGKSLHFNIHASVCTGITVNYTPDGQYTSFKSLGDKMVEVPAIDLGLQFTELKLVTREDIEFRGF